MHHHSSLWSNVWSISNHGVTRTELDVPQKNETKYRKPLFTDTGQQAGWACDPREKGDKGGRFCDSAGFRHGGNFLTTHTDWGENHRDIGYTSFYIWRHN